VSTCAPRKCEGRRGPSSAVEVAVVAVVVVVAPQRPACRFISDDDIIDNAVRSPITAAMSRIGERGKRKWKRTSERMAPKKL